MSAIKLYIDALEKCRDRLAGILREFGTETLPNEKFNTLVEKVAKIKGAEKQVQVNETIPMSQILPGSINPVSLIDLAEVHTDAVNSAEFMDVFSLCSIETSDITVSNFSNEVETNVG